MPRSAWSTPACFALGIAIISTARSFAVDLLHFLFGNVLSVTGADLVRIGVVSALITAVILLFYKELVLVTFDRVFAASLRLKSTLFTYLLYLLMALAIVVALQTIGIALVVTLMVSPAAAALQFTRRRGRGHRLRRGGALPLLLPQCRLRRFGRAGVRGHLSHRLRAGPPAGQVA